MKLDRIRELLSLMETHGLEELELEDKDFKVRLKKEAASPPPAPVATGGAAAGASAAEASATETPAGGFTIVSPIVGTFYRAPSPDADQFVHVGDRVTPDTTLCVIEAMKVMNEIKAEMEGQIAAILVENGEPVEFGQPLFRITA